MTQRSIHSTAHMTPTPVLPTALVVGSPALVTCTLVLVTLLLTVLTGAGFGFV